MISQRSRYVNSTVAKLPTRDGTSAVRAVIAKTPGVKVFNFTYYRVRDIDRIDGLARYFFGDETAWWIIANANPEILAWDEIEDGTIIRIPDA
jgi:phage tail protein X